MDKAALQYARSIRWQSLSPATCRNGVDGHIRKLNLKYPYGYGLPEIRSYLSAQTQLKPQSLEVLAYGIMFAVKERLGMELIFDSGLQGVLKTFFSSYRVPRRSRSAPRAVSLKDLSSFVSRCGIVARYWTEFLFLSSLRVSEACSVRLSDCRNTDEGCVIRVRQKGGNFKEVLIPSDIYLEIRHVFRSKIFLLETRTERPYRRQDVAAILRAQSERLLGYRITPHMLRHSFGTYIATQRPDLIRGGITQMGHSSPDTFFKFYVHQKLKPGDIPRITGVA